MRVSERTCISQLCMLQLAGVCCMAEVVSGLQLRENMPRLVEAVQSAGQIVTWVCDPMHGNTESVAGYKTPPLRAHPARGAPPSAGYSS